MSSVNSSRPPSTYNSTANSGGENRDAFGNRGRARKRAALITSIYSKFLCLVNAFLLILAIVMFGRAFAFQAGFREARSQKTVELSFGAEDAIHLEQELTLIQAYRTASDFGEFLWFNSSTNGIYGISIKSIDTGMSHVLGVQTLDRAIFFLSHACVVDSSENVGILAYSCALTRNVDDDLTHDDCGEKCVVSTDAYGTTYTPLEYHDNFELDEYYRTKNSIGFGVTYTEEHILDISYSENQTYNLVMELRSNAKSNAQEKYGIPWQDILVWFLMIDITTNTLGRLMTCPVLWGGILIRKTKVLVKADLPGGMFTSPGRGFILFIMTVVCGAQNFLFLDVGQYPHSFDSHFWCISSIASMTSVMLTMLFAHSEFRFYATGSMLFFMAALARGLTFETIQDSAQSELRGLGQILERECTLFSANGTVVGAAMCNIADGCGMSGLEIFYVILFEPLFVTFFLLFAFELFINVARRMKNLVHKLHLTKVEVASSSRSSTGKSSSTKKKYQNNTLTTVFGVSDYDKCVFLSKRGKSVFSRAWASPIHTILGKFTHASTLIEDDLVMYGPILMRMNTFPILAVLGKIFGKKRIVEIVISNKLYVGVLADRSKLNSHLENGVVISNFMAEYDYTEMPDLLNGEPLQ